VALGHQLQHLALARREIVPRLIVGAQALD
jgi:hypothetical protein